MTGGVFPTDAMKVQITTYYLEMKSPEELRPALLDDPAVEVRRSEIPCPELNRFFYTAVGGDWFWVERLSWNYEKWARYVERPGFETWICYLRGTPCGYFTLERQEKGNVEIRNFGLLPRFTGKGLGGHLLTEAVRKAWEGGAKRVWVHTCSLDHPGALGNYLGRGFKLYKTEVSEKEIPEKTPGPWPGAKE